MNLKAIRSDMFDANDPDDHNTSNDHPARTLQFGDQGEDDDICHAAALTSPYVGATFAIADLQAGGSLGVPDDLTTLSMTLKAQTTSCGESLNTLMLQTRTLDTMFNQLISRAMRDGRLDVQESYLKLAMKAQNQCRATLQTISDIRQQNAAKKSKKVPTEETTKTPTKLIELLPDDKPLDT